MRKTFVLATAVFYFLFHAGAALPPAEKMLPDDTLLMFTLPDFTKVRDLYQNSPQGRFWNDPSMKDFKDKFINKLDDQYIIPLEHELGIHFADYTNLPQGQVTIALIQNGWQGKEGQSPAALFLVDTKGQSGQLKSNLTDLKKKWVDAGKKIRTEKVRDVDFSVVTLSADDIPKTIKKTEPAAPGLPEPMENPDVKNAKSELYIGQADSLLIVGNSPKPIEKILARIAGESVKSLGELAAYDASSGIFHDSPAFGWANLKTFIEVVARPSGDPADSDASNPFGFTADKVVTALGLKGLRTLAFSLTANDEGSMFNVNLAVPESDRTGLIKILAGEAKEFNPPPFVPADAVKFQRWRMDGQKAYATLRKMLSDISPTAVGSLDFVLSSADAAAKEKDPNFDLNKNLFGNLGDDIITYQKNPKGGSLAELNSPPSIFLLGSPNAEKLANALKNVLVLLPQTTPPTERELLGHKIYSIPLPGPPGADGSPTIARTISYASSGGYLAITTDASLIDEYLRSTETPPKPLREMAGLAEATQKVAGASTSLFGFSNDSESMRVLFETLKKDSNAADPLAGVGPLLAARGMNPVKMSDWVDVSLLPPFEKVSKYFYFSVYGGAATADGLSFKVFAPVSPQLKK